MLLFAPLSLFSLSSCALPSGQPQNFTIFFFFRLLIFVFYCVIVVSIIQGHDDLPVPNLEKRRITMGRRKFEDSKKNLITLSAENASVRPPLPAICERVRYYRMQRKLEQKELARKLGITANAVSNWEQGRGSLTVE